MYVSNNTKVNITYNIYRVLSKIFTRNKIGLKKGIPIRRRHSSESNQKMESFNLLNQFIVLSPLKYNDDTIFIKSWNPMFKYAQHIFKNVEHF